MTDTKAFANALRQTDVLLFIIALAISAVSILIRSYKWKVLLTVQGAALPLKRVHTITYMALFFNNFFLGSLGGDAFRIHKTSYHSTQKSGSASAVIMDRFTGVLILVFIVTFSAIGASMTDNCIISVEQLFPIAGIGLAVLIFSSTIFFGLSKIAAIVSNLRETRLRSITLNVVANLSAYKYHKKSVINSLILSFAFYLSSIISMFFWSLAANVYVHLIHWAFIVPLVAFLIMVPISVNGLGVQEGTFFLYLEKLGVDSSSALLIALLPRIGTLIFSLVGGLLYILESSKKNIE